jgi:uncharacterized membrane protein YidH (DUF202 family)
VGWVLTLPHQPSPQEGFYLFSRNLETKGNMADHETQKYLFTLEGEELVKAMEEWVKRLEPLAADRAKLALLNNVLAEERNLLAYLRNQLSQKRSELAAERTELARRRTDWAQSRTEYAEMRNKLAEVRTRMSGGRTSLAQSRTNLAQYRTILAKQRTELSYLRTGLTLIAIGTIFTRMFGLGYWSIIDGIITLTGIASIGMAVKLFIRSYSVERKLLLQLEKELSPMAVEERMEDAIQSHRFSGF